MHLVFFFPYKRISGVPVLFSTLAEYISTNFSGIDVSIIDYEDGIINQLVKNVKVNRIIFEDFKKVYVPKGAILILQSILPFSIRPELQINDDQQLFFWNLHPNCLILNNITKNKIFDKIINHFRIITRANIKSFVEFCITKEGLVFMDDSNSTRTLKYYGISLKPTLLQICGKPNEELLHNKNNDIIITDTLNFSYIGRVVDFKYYPLKKALSTLDALVKKEAIKKNIKFYIVGEGEMIGSLISFVSQNITFIEVVFTGAIDNKKIHSFLTDNQININFAMGTSVLDSIQLGVPTILLNYAYCDINGYPIYYFADEEMNYSLGRELNSNELHDSNLISLNNCINNYISDPNKYVLNSLKYSALFSVNVVSKLFIEKISASKLYYSDVKKYFHKSIIRKLYNRFKYNLYS